MKHREYSLGITIERDPSVFPWQKVDGGYLLGTNVLLELERRSEEAKREWGEKILGAIYEDATRRG